MARIIELKWDCADCDTANILGRHKRCPSCGSPREKGEMKMKGLNTDRDGDGYNDAETVTDPALLRKATAGSDWFCTHCHNGNTGTGNRCSSCGAPRYGEADENHPSFPRAHHRALPDEPAPGVGRVDPAPGGEQERAKPRRKPRPAPSYESDPVDDWRARRAKEQRRNKTMMGVGAAFLVLSALLFTWWATQTHEETGTVQASSWTHTVKVWSWEQITQRLWEDDTRQRAEIEPSNGSGERAGLNHLGGCREEHHHYEEYQCGTQEESYECGGNESYSGTCSRQVKSGESCQDNGNGFASCSPTYSSESYSCTKTRFVSKTCYRTVPKYCDRSIEETKCNYATQEWQHNRTRNNAGTGAETTWPTVELARLEKATRHPGYEIVVAYTNRGEADSHDFEPTNLGTYEDWATAPQVYLSINNLGGVSDARLTVEPAP